MKALQTNQRKICNRVKAVFQHPDHFLTVLQRQDNYISLYDEKVMSQSSVSAHPFSEKIQYLVFSRSLGVFYAYFHCKNLMSNFKLCPFLAIFSINQHDKIQFKKIILTKNEGCILSTPSSMGLLQINNQQQPSDILISLQSSSFRLIDTHGHVLEEHKLICQNRQIECSKSYILKDNGFIITQQNILMNAVIEYDQYSITQQMKFQQKIINVFIDTSSRKRYMGVLLQDNSMQIVSISTSKYKNYYNLALPSFSISHFCFFYPAVNTSATNKYKHLIYAIFTGNSILKPRPQRHLQRQVCRYMDQNSLKHRNIYCYEFKQIWMDSHKQMTRLKQTNIFFIRQAGTIKTLLFNEDEYNCIRVINQDHLVSYNLVSMFGNNKVDQQWIYLAANFQHCPQDRSVYYQEREDEFQNISKKRQISQEELDDWSLGPLASKQIHQSKGRRLANLVLF